MQTLIDRFYSEFNQEALALLDKAVWLTANIEHALNEKYIEKQKASNRNLRQSNIKNGVRSYVGMSRVVLRIKKNKSELDTPEVLRKTLCALDYSREATGRKKNYLHVTSQEQVKAIQRFSFTIRKKMRRKNGDYFLYKPSSMTSYLDDNEMLWYLDFMNASMIDVAFYFKTRLLWKALMSSETEFLKMVIRATHKEEIKYLHNKSNVALRQIVTDQLGLKISISYQQKETDYA
ncbi:hypothetical protein L0B53_18895 (plasmid) [Vibrio sp. SS-MA-C1-2]|uniref:hypothetical protein n=1 Tax=Vibrio sp. SS-MA-C1-2 TaxID=2908646 RepID=UPI001F21376A|nr:hypothetical protein [Vibrio sp. SS-MA-C1-2]UJF20204.1 hypothetical protein L0B53_18895 [Vibrio sp. SS-MA-C1-2]